MELFFLALLILAMAGALASGFPVAFALPGSAILTIGLAALTGYVFTGDASSFFAQDGPIQWLTAGVTNFRGVYWEVERDTIIAVPLFVFMGIMLQRSKIAEDLLVTMARLFGPVPGGLGISVVLVGALLAATTGILGATVVAMGLISLPAMLRNGYSRPLATGTISAAGTLGQIIPPSIVLIILADQLSNATDQAGTLRQVDFKAATGQFIMPTEFGITSASAGDMFLGAIVPGLVLVSLYVIYILVVALIRPNNAPAIPLEGRFDRHFAVRVVLALVPPLALILAVLGSIIAGIATVNQAGAIGAIGATIMAGYRLAEGKPRCYTPAIIAGVSLIALFVLLATFDLNIRTIHSAYEAVGVSLAGIAVAGLVVAVAWSIWRAHSTEQMLAGVMVETAKTTAMVFIILLGAAMLTAAFRSFGGEELVKEFLTTLPGGFWAQFVVVMAVIFILGFFLDFIEIAVVVVPIVAPILLSDPSANITAVWLGVMIGVNMQTSFPHPAIRFRPVLSARRRAPLGADNRHLPGRGPLHSPAARGPGHRRLLSAPGELPAGAHVPHRRDRAAAPEPAPSALPGTVFVRAVRPRRPDDPGERSDGPGPRHQLPAGKGPQEPDGRHGEGRTHIRPGFGGAPNQHGTKRVRRDLQACPFRDSTGQQGGTADRPRDARAPDHHPATGTGCRRGRCSGVAPRGRGVAGTKGPPGENTPGGREGDAPAVPVPGKEGEQRPPELPAQCRRRLHLSAIGPRDAGQGTGLGGGRREAQGIAGNPPNANGTAVTVGDPGRRAGTPNRSRNP